VGNDAAAAERRDTESVTRVVAAQQPFLRVDLLAAGLSGCLLSISRSTAPPSTGRSPCHSTEMGAQKLSGWLNAMFARDDARYARLLTILANELRKRTTVP
jgi:hypothetical protein